MRGVERRRGAGPLAAASPCPTVAASITAGCRRGRRHRQARPGHWRTCGSIGMTTVGVIGMSRLNSMERALLYFWCHRKHKLPKSQRPRCGARCRDGHPCRVPVVVKSVWGGLSTRCRMHGGLSPARAPRRAGAARWKHWSEAGRRSRNASGSGAGPSRRGCDVRKSGDGGRRRRSRFALENKPSEAHAHLGVQSARYAREEQGFPHINARASWATVSSSSGMRG
jgi:hypothetical protein